MSQVVVDNQKVDRTKPVDLLKEVSVNKTYGCLKVSSNSVSWLIYFHTGRITYATNSIAPYERFERYLRRLKRDPSHLINAVRQQRQLNANEQPNGLFERPEYHSVCWLIEQKHLSGAEAASLVKLLTKEALETFLLIPNLVHTELTEFLEDVQAPNLCHLELQPLLEECYQRFQFWQALAPEICSSYQRPYFSNTASSQNKVPTAQLQRLSKVLKGLNFRQLTVVFNQDELQIAQKLHPLIKQRIIVLREPQPPFDKLPKIPSSSLINFAPSPPQDKSNGDRASSDRSSSQPHNDGGAGSVPVPENTAPKWRIACVDDSPTVLNEINRLLESPDIAISKIDDPLKALLKIVQIKPDLILLDVGMPNIDGYNLCSLLRKNSQFKSTPIVMVTGHKGLIDRAKAKLAGATDYLTKPFSKADLLNIVSKYLK